MKKLPAGEACYISLRDAMTSLGTSGSGSDSHSVYAISAIMIEMVLLLWAVSPRRLGVWTLQLMICACKKKLCKIKLTGKVSALPE
ncbi:uncharacterized protein G2W53_041182 [Senna tora]|uniref:Uncharacterized protein n=1 Tax=Senna tora TaxID=362788 RepID=A0A834W143_9FABA|nr:uncharacterized protein G2W53_041182 [Senna tora]